jgi:protein-S-isoprenylcysteine O-methyltransferase Ste14
MMDGFPRSVILFERSFVWIGGILFAASIAACVYMYAVPWASPAGSGAGSRTDAVAGDVALFTLFALHHSFFARAAVKTRVERLVPARLTRSVYVWTASLILLGVLACWQRVGGDLYRVRGTAAIALAAVQLGGVLLGALAVAAVDPLDLAGIRARPGSGLLRLDGPYRLVRHPLYLGWIAATFATPHMTGDRLAFAAISSAYLVIAIPFEERSLVGAFGPAYAEYARQVRWRVVPYVY